MHTFRFSFSRVSLQHKILFPSLFFFLFLVIIIAGNFYGFQQVSTFTAKILTESAEHIAAENTLSYLIHQTQEGAQYYFLSGNVDDKKKVEQSITELKKLPSVKENDSVKEALELLEEVIAATAVRFDSLSNQRKSALTLTNEIRSSATSSDRAKINDLLGFLDQVIADIYFPNPNNTSTIEGLFQKISKSVETEKQRYNIEDLWDSWAGYIAVHTKLLSDADSRLQTTLQVLRKFQEDYVRSRELEFDNLKNQTQEKIKSIRLFVLVLAAAGVILSVIIALKVASSISKPTLKCVSMANTIAQGDVREKLKLSQLDEIGELGNSMDEMIDSLRNRADLAKQIAGGDLSQNVTVYSEHDTLGTALDTMTNNLRSLIQKIQLNSSTVANSSTALAQASGSLSSSSEETLSQTNAVSKAAKVIENQTTEISASSQQISTSMQSVASAIEELSTSLAEVGKASTSSAEITNSVLVQAEKTTTEMMNLEQAAKEINEVTNTINELTDQTKLLALNATIEAARAGESGKGFAVVASEVKELAQQSAAAAERIAQRIKNIQNQSTSVAQAISSFAKTVNEVNEASISISSAVLQQTHVTDDIAASISETNSSTNSINKSIADLAERVGEIASNIEGLNKSSEANISEILSIDSSIKELDATASQLQSVVTTFKLTSNES